MSRWRCQHFQRPGGKFNLLSFCSWQIVSSPSVFLLITSACGSGLLTSLICLLIDIHAALGLGFSFPLSSWWIPGQSHSKMTVQAKETDSMVECSVWGGTDDSLWARKSPGMESTTTGVKSSQEMCLRVLTWFKSYILNSIQVSQVRWKTQVAVCIVPS